MVMHRREAPPVSESVQWRSMSAATGRPDPAITTSALPATRQAAPVSRRVPEAAPLVGVVLAFGFALYGVLFAGDHLAIALGTVALLYPFVAAGVVRSDDPTPVFRPHAVLAAGCLAGATLSSYGMATGRPLFGSLVGVAAAAPPVAYHVRYGTSVNPLPPTASTVVGLGAAAGFLAYSVAAGRLLHGAVTALAVGLLAVDYRRQRGDPLARRARTAALVACLGGGLLAFGALAASGRPAAGLAAGGVLVGIGAFLAVGAAR